MFVPKAGRQAELVSPSSFTAPAVELAASGPRGPNFTLGEWAPLSVILTHDAVAVLRGTSVESAASFMLRMSLDSLPVIDGAGGLLGVVSTRDLLAEAADQREAVEQDAGLQPNEREALSLELDGGFHGTCLSTASVGDVMTPSTLALSDSIPISRAVMIMTRDGHSELPVKCQRCNGYCTVSALELLAWLSRSRQGTR